MKRLARFLGGTLSDDEASHLVARYRPQSLRDACRVHFNQRIAGRHNQIMSPDQLQLCNEVFGAQLQRIGYASGALVGRLLLGDVTGS